MRILTRTLAVLGGVAVVAYVAVSFLVPTMARDLALNTGSLITAYPVAFVATTVSLGAAVMCRAAFAGIRA